MKVESLQELEKLIKLLRKTGVESINIGEIELKLSPDEPVSKYKKSKSAHAGPEEPVPSAGFGGYAAEDVAFWSSTPPGAEPPKDS